MRGIALLLPLLLWPALPWPGAAEVYRWTDADGAVHYGDTPRPDATVLRVFGPPKGVRGVQGARVEVVLDGDTLRLTDGRDVRLLGINAPEIPHRGRPGQPGGLEAQRALERLVGAGAIDLTVGGEGEDDYGRTLAYVAADGTDLAEALLREGRAWAVAGFGEHPRIEAYFRAEAAARAAGSGIWADPRYQVQPAANAEAYRNSFRRLRGRVQRVREARRYLYLELAGLTAYVDMDSNLAAFRRAGVDPAELAGRDVTLRGWITQREGAPALRLVHPLQIECSDLYGWAGC